MILKFFYKLLQKVIILFSAAYTLAFTLAVQRRVLYEINVTGGWVVVKSITYLFFGFSAGLCPGDHPLIDHSRNDPMAIRGQVALIFKKPFQRVPLVKLRHCGGNIDYRNGLHV